jgi:hypothetical protein
MNEQIKSLANIWANRRREDPELGIVYVFTEAALQVFADKIIAKCAEQVDALRAPHGNEQVEYALHMAEKKIQELATPYVRPKPKCHVCGTTENVRYMGGYQEYLCDSAECIPF